MPAVIKPPIPNPPAIKPAVEEINEAALTTSEIFIRGSYFRDIVEKTLQKITYRAVITRFDRLAFPPIHAPPALIAKQLMTIASARMIPKTLFFA